MIYQGVLTKMTTELASAVQYYLLFEQDFLHMNQLLDKRISINFLRFQCMNCKRQKKIFRSGHCYNCHTSLPELGDWIMRPELSKAHLGIEDRNLEKEREIQLAPHIVYLANSSNVKVGVTRKTQVPTRWIDQGAWKAAIIAEVPYRQMAGLIEIELKQYLSDRTDWRKMLIDERDEDDLHEICKQLVSFLPREYQQYGAKTCNVREFKYPVIAYPEKIKSLKLEDRRELIGELAGIRGQYLYFKGGNVINLRKYSGYEVTTGTL